jgi:hypothetical protein
MGSIFDLMMKNKRISAQSKAGPDGKMHHMEAHEF